MSESDNQLETEKTPEETPVRQGASGSLNNLYRDWFLDYASYVILDRAIPALDDGLKPVQRRIMHALSDLEDGRFNKAANVIGHTMRYHPHGDMAINDAMVKLAQKELLIETQGNWGNPVTGDRAAAPRYIEARLSEFAKEVIFDPETTEWQPSYDGRNKEPVMLPVKFPLLLAQGVEGIAVGLSTKILPHNFNELLRESVAVLKGFKPQFFPDFHTGGVADFTDYKDGKKGGKIRVRAKIVKSSARLLAVKEIPFGLTTSGLIDSVLAAHDKGQIKIKKVIDNTSDKVEILIHLPAGADEEKAREALYAFTDCEISLSPNCCVIFDGKPHFCGVSELLEYSVKRTKSLLQQEQQILQNKLKEKIFFGILEHFFIQEKIYRKIENCESYEDILKKIARALKPVEKHLHRPVRTEDIEKLTEIKIKRISKFDQSTAETTLTKLKKELSGVNKNLRNMTEFTIAWYEQLLKKYGKNQKRRTKIESFAKVNVSGLIQSDQKVYINHKEGFIGTSLKKDDFLLECTKLDELIAFCQDGSFQVSKVSDKAFYGKNILDARVFRRKEHAPVYQVLYKEGRTGPVLGKRFSIASASRDRQYFIAKDQSPVKILYLSVGSADSAEEVTLRLKNSDKKEIIFDFSSLKVKARTAKGIQICSEPVAKITLNKTTVRKKSKALNQRLWYDRTQNSLNVENRGHYLGKFSKDSEKLIIVRMNGTYIISDPELDMDFPKDVVQVEKFTAPMVISTIYADKSTGQSCVVRAFIDSASPGSHTYCKKTTGSKIKLATLTKLSEKEAKKRSAQKNAPEEEKIPLEKFFDAKTLKIIEKKFG